MRRFFDLVFSLLGIFILSPLMIIIYILIILESRGGGFYIQKRVGKDGIDFNLFKFRSMRKDSDQKGLITVGTKDPRLTKIGFFIRRFKIDELPQLFNVLLGQMSLVGPRPEVRYYVDMYSPEQRLILKLRPGITDYASIEYINENTILGSSNDPEKMYVEQIMPGKIQLNMKYLQEQTLKTYFHIIFLTFRKVFVKSKVQVKSEA